jgi:phage tail sheath gpL-like
MPISFENIPADWRQPLYYVEVDPSQAGFPTLRQPALLVGTMLSTGSAVADTPVPIASQAAADAAFGKGSQLARMFKAFFANNFAHEVWGLPLTQPGAGVAATGTITVSAPPTDAGTLDLYIAGQLVEVAVGASDSANTVAASINAAINANGNLPVTSTVSTNVVTMTSRWKGLTGNDIDVRDSYFGPFGGEVRPAGLGLTYSNSGKLSGGTSAPTMTTAIANLGDQVFEFVAMPFTDSTSLGAWKTEYGFGDTGRWGWLRQLYGHVFSFYRDSYANTLVWGATQNSGVVSVLGVEVNSPSPGWEWAAAYTAKAARSLTIDPARPLQTLELAGILPAPKHQRFSITERNALAGAGIATQSAGLDDVVQIKRESTTYQLNKYGQGDDAYELVTTLATLARLIRNQRHAVTSKWPRHKLADDGTNFGPGQAIVTPKTVKAELVAQYRIDEFNGLVENVKAFKANLIVERDSNNPNRLNVLYPPDLINGLRIFAVLAQFRLQYERGLTLNAA